jgi:hypothetical protein
MPEALLTLSGMHDQNADLVLASFNVASDESGLRGLRRSTLSYTGPAELVPEEGIRRGFIRHSREARESSAAEVWGGGSTQLHG